MPYRGVCARGAAADPDPIGVTAAPVVKDRLGEIDLQDDLEFACRDSIPVGGRAEPGVGCRPRGACACAMSPCADRRRADDARATTRFLHPSRHASSREPASLVKPLPGNIDVIVGEEAALALAPGTDELGGIVGAVGILPDGNPMRGRE